MVNTPSYNDALRRSYDLLAASDYGINECGFIRSDFAELNERNDAAGLARLLSRFQQISADESYQNLTDEQKFALIRPRGMQTPAELDRFEQYCIDQGIEFARDILGSDVADAAGVPPVSESTDVSES